MRIYVDADACPVKDEVLTVAVRHDVPVTYVGNTWMRGLNHPLVDQKVAPEGLDAADNLIVELIGAGDVVVTADIPLAGRCLAKGAMGIDPRGKVFDPANIGMTVAMRDLMTHLRDIGEASGVQAAYGRLDRSRFLSALDTLLVKGRRTAQ